MANESLSERTPDDHSALDPAVAEGVEGRAAERVEERVAERIEERAAERAVIAGSIDELLPTLIAKLGATGMAELEVRQDGLRVRLRRPADGRMSHERHAADRASRGDRGRAATAGSPNPAAVGSPQFIGLMPVGPGRETRDAGGLRVGGELLGEASAEDIQAVATSPAVGIYHPHAEARAGTRVRAGDRLGTVDMLGVPQEVVAPSDGLVGASFVESGDAVEYGQDLVVIEFASASSSTGSADR